MRRSLLIVTSALALVTPPVARAAEGDIIVQRAPRLNGAERRELRAGAGVELVRRLPLERTELVEPAPGETVVAALAALRADGDVVYAELDRAVTIARTPDDSLFGQLWGLHNLLGTDIDATDAWDQSEGDGVTVAVVDTGINADHVDLVGQIAGNAAEVDGTPGVDDDRNGYIDDFRGWDFVSGDNLPQDGHGHGTHVSGTIAAEGENTTGVIGVAPWAKVVPLRALNNNGSGTMSQIASAFDYAGDLGLKIVNASIGGAYSLAVKSAIDAHPGTLYVVAAGNAAANSDTDADAYPCALPEANIVCVGATDRGDAPASFSNYGPATVDLFAPGVDIVSTYKDSPSAYAAMSGTSMAAPHVAGAAALALAANPSASISFLRWSVLSSVDAKAVLKARSVSGGRLNANRAVTAIKGAEPVATPTATATPAPEAPVATPAPVAPVATATPVVGIVAPGPTVTPPLVLTRVAVGGSLRTRTSKLKVTFRLSRAGTVKITIKRRGAKTALASWSLRGRSGANAVTLTRKLPTGRTLTPGAYTLAVAVSATASSSRSIRVP